MEFRSEPTQISRNKVVKIANEILAWANHCGKSEDPAEMAYSRMASNKCGLSAKREAQNECTESRYPGCRSEQQRARVCVGSDGARASQRTFPVDAVAEELEDVRICTPGARTRAVQPWAARSGARDALRSLICSTRTHLCSCEQCESIVHASMQGKRRPRHTGQYEASVQRGADVGDVSRVREV